MADESWRKHPIVTSGPGGGESIVGMTPDEQLVLPPGHLAQQEAARTTFDAARSGANTGTFGMYDRAAGGMNVFLGNAPDYSTGVNEQVKLTEVARARSPIATTAADIVAGGAGGLGLARTGITAVPYLASRFGRLASGGGQIAEAGALGGLGGAGQTYTGRPEDYFANAGWGASIGAPFGLLSPVAGVAGEGVYRGVASTRGVPGRLLESARTSQPELQDLIAGRYGPRANLADISPGMLGTGQGSVLNPVGAGQVEYLKNLKARRESSDPFIDQRTNEIFGPIGRAEVPSVIQSDVVQPRIDALKPHYEAAYAKAKAVDATPIADWLQNKIVNSTGEARTQMQRIRADLDIQGAPGNLDPNPGKLGAIRSDIKGMLRQEELKPGTYQSGTIGLLKEADRRMTEELRAKVPGIHALDSIRAELGSQERALLPTSATSRMFETGKGRFIHPEEFKDILAEARVPKGTLTTTEEPLRLDQAARYELGRIVGTRADDLRALESLLNVPYNARKFEMAFGKDKADEINSVIRNERIGRETDTAIRLGSQTAQRQAAMKAQDEAGGRLGLQTTPTGLVARGVDYLKDKLFERQAASQRDRIAGFMASTNPTETQAAARQLLATLPERDARAILARTMMQGGFRGTSAGFVPKDYRTE